LLIIVVLTELYVIKQSSKADISNRIHICSNWKWLSCHKVFSM